ncbi:hypothetical protein PoB_002084600 [Plakobranchus ocellatus]|uniref:Uncharacterized protein n=1 Tax=Plakobranchus ocellatus TaxID=259542 RepID=A0AAV3Z4X4_9GAST|nr:hypothetical protein PoB_002084600 [Plakobranchus ocellatus]
MVGVRSRSPRVVLKLSDFGQPSGHLGKRLAIGSEFVHKKEISGFQEARGIRTCDRRVPADPRTVLLSTVSPTPLCCCNRQENPVVRQSVENQSSVLVSLLAVSIVGLICLCFSSPPSFRGSQHSLNAR